MAGARQAGGSARQDVVIFAGASLLYLFYDVWSMVNDKFRSFNSKQEGRAKACSRSNKQAAKLVQGTSVPNKVKVQGQRCYCAALPLIACCCCCCCCCCPSLAACPSSGGLGSQCRAKVWLMMSGNRMEASPHTLTGCASARILPHETASSGRAPAAGTGARHRCASLWVQHPRPAGPPHGRCCRRTSGPAATASGHAPTSRPSLQLQQPCAPLSLPSNSWAVLTNTAKSAPFFMRFALQMWCLGTPAVGQGQGHASRGAELRC